MPDRGSDHVNAGTPKPVNWDELWFLFPIRDIPARTIKDCPGYWQGTTATWQELLETGNGQRPALLVERSGLVVLDCDVRGEFAAAGGKETAVTLELRHGVDDLTRLCREREKELPVTFTVSTPSGGAHLYFRQNRYCPVTSRGQREAWRIDVKASPNSYVIAPPADGYAVTQDRPVAVLPYWLARHIRRIGARPQRRPNGITALTGQSRDGILRFVAETNTNGSWNNSVYWAAHRLIEAGESLEDITAALLEAAAPWDEREAEKARRTIASAWRNARGS